jgi:hypothetical protein
MENQELINKLSNWINTEGIPLEYFTASVFMQNRFRVFQGDFVEEKGSAREIDVIAFKDYQNNGSLIRISSVVECKWTKDKPWIVFTSPNAHMAKSACIAQTIGSRVGSSLMWHIAGENELYDMSLFTSNTSSGFSGRQAFTKDTDLFYNTIQGIVNKTYLSVKEYDENEKDPFRYIAIGFPIIVIEGLLYETHYTTGNIELIEVNYSKVHWRGSTTWKHHAIVSIVTKDYLPEFIAKLSSEFDIIGSKAIPALENIKYFNETQNINVLSHKPAARGIVGFPSFLYNIAKASEK